MRCLQWAEAREREALGQAKANPRTLTKYVEDLDEGKFGHQTFVLNDGPAYFEMHWRSGEIDETRSTCWVPEREAVA